MTSAEYDLYTITKNGLWVIPRIGMFVEKNGRYYEITAIDRLLDRHTGRFQVRLSLCNKNESIKAHPTEISIVPEAEYVVNFVMES